MECSILFKYMDTGLYKDSLLNVHGRLNDLKPEEEVSAATNGERRQLIADHAPNHDGSRSEIIHASCKVLGA